MTSGVVSRQQSGSGSRPMWISRPVRAAQVVKMGRAGRQVLDHDPHVRLGADLLLVRAGNRADAAVDALRHQFGQDVGERHGILKPLGRAPVPAG